MTIEELIDLYGDHLIVFSNPDYDSAIIGVTYDDRVVYDYDKMVIYLMDAEGMSLTDAIEFIDYNTARATSYIGEGAPIIMYNHTIKHGKWINKHDYLWCSACGAIGARAVTPTNYCDKCGAKMDLEKENN